jgi:predicted RNA methylase
MTKAELAKVPSDYKGTRMSECGTHRLRLCVQRGHAYAIVFLTDSKQHARPGAVEVEQAALESEAAHSAAIRQAVARAETQAAARAVVAPELAAKAAAAAPFVAIAESLKAGVQVVAAPQLFPTPSELASRMVADADIQPGDSVLEPSAGTGRIVDAILARDSSARVVAVEINSQLSEAMGRRVKENATIRLADFLQCDVELLGSFDRILMNPPFSNGQDIAHIKHALTFLRPGGRLIAICADGPRQNEHLRPIVEQMGGTWEPLPPDTFKESGTSVRTALINLTVEEGKSR